MLASIQTTNIRFRALSAPIDHTAFRETWNANPHENPDLLIEYATANAAGMAALRSTISNTKTPSQSWAIAHCISGVSHIVDATTGSVTIGTAHLPAAEGIAIAA